MNPTLSDNILICGYFLIWIVTFVVYHWKFHNVDAGTTIIGSYVFYAFFSIITLNNPIFFLDYYDFKPLTLFPFIYLYIMLMIALSPTIYHHYHPVEKLVPLNTKLLYILSVAMIISAIVMLPEVLMNFQDGIIKLITDTDAGKDAYSEQLEEASDSGGVATNVLSIFFNACSEIAIFTWFYFMTMKKKNLWLIFGLLICIVVAILQPIMLGQRGPVMYTVMTLLLAYSLFRRFLSKAINRIVNITGIIGAILVIVPISAITVSRFSTMKQSTVTDYINWYIGQGNIYFNNYGLDNNGIRYGDRTFNLIKRFIDPNASINFMDRRAYFHNLLINDDVFTTFVGDFTIDFGPVVAFLIFVVFNILVLRGIQTKNKEMKVHQLLLLYFTMCICMQGGMTLFPFSDTANLKMACFLMLYIYLYLYEKLIKKYPKRIYIVKHKSKKFPKINISVKK
ncbi:MAG: oligosaccharide repeat unit polymerase [Bacteroidaceae bacterium]|nr:oligosaccharide repeat unit polymerase [Bacteroidaceae bacterium]